MRARIVFALLSVLVADVAMAKEHSYDKGKIVSMESTSCGMAEKSSKTIAGELLGTDGDHKNTQEVLCQEYVLQSEHVLYRIRPLNQKHPALLPIGEDAQFRVDNDKLILRVPESDGKERSYSVVSMTQHDADQDKVASNK